ncbi:MAG: hypothetical protein ABH832_00525 [bacterium]
MQLEERTQIPINLGSNDTNLGKESFSNLTDDEMEEGFSGIPGEHLMTNREAEDLLYNRTEEIIKRLLGSELTPNKAATEAFIALKNFFHLQDVNSGGNETIDDSLVHAQDNIRRVLTGVMKRIQSDLVESFNAVQDEGEKQEFISEEAIKLVDQTLSLCKMATLDKDNRDSN